MIKLIDTYPKINTLYVNGQFSFEKWETYINSIYDNSAHIFKKDVEEYLRSGEYTFEQDFLPHINSVYNHPALYILHDSFLTVTNQLNSRISKYFGIELDIDLVLYLGLCNAAGWVTNINGRDTILLGIEKIIELNWQDIDSMHGLIYHELGHVYHKQYGCLKQQSNDSNRNFVWQLFTEGIAMYFEQVLVGDFTYYHQNVNGWTEWCESNFSRIVNDFNNDLSTMNRMNQRYFGDWVNYYNHSDVGYYLGTRFVHWLVHQFRLIELINLDMNTIYDYYLQFVTMY